MLAILLDSNVSIVDFKTVELNDFNEKEAAVTFAAPPTICEKPVRVLICSPAIVDILVANVSCSATAHFMRVPTSYLTALPTSQYGDPVILNPMETSTLISGPKKPVYLKPVWFEKELPTVVDVDCPNVVENENPRK